MKLIALTAVLMISIGAPAFAQTDAIDAGKPIGVESAELEKLKAENDRLKQANTALELDKLKQENQQLKEANSKLTQSPIQTTTKPATWRSVLHRVGRGMQGAVRGAQAGSQIAPHSSMQTSRTTFSNGVTAQTTTYPY